MDTRTFLVLDYFEDFHCKCGQCRHNCCDGWAVTFSRDDYFRLLSVPCSPELRRKLDISLHMTNRPSPERYAQLLPNWEGHCPLQREDGLCGLQTECGEDGISTTCRYYPRGFRTLDDNQCACSASCEQVVELLLARRTPLTFHWRALTLAIPVSPRVPAQEAEHTRSLRQDMIAMLQVREKPMAQRLMGLYAAIGEEESGQTTCEQRWQAYHAASDVPMPAPDWRKRATLLRLLIEKLFLDSASMGDYAAEVLPLLTPDGLQTSIAQLAQDEPDTPIYLEQLMVNHVFYEGFPFSDHMERPKMGALSLTATYAVLHGMMALYHALHPEREQLVDVIASCFRVMEHSPFGWNAAVVLEQAGCAGEESLRELAGV